MQVNASDKGIFICYNVFRGLWKLGAEIITMSNKEKIVWRMGKLPTIEEIRQLVTDKILTPDEAREILFSQETEEERDIKSLEAEIKFLRELVQKLSENKTQIVRMIEQIHVPYKKYDWVEPYMYYCNASSGGAIYTATGGASTTTASYSSNSGTSVSALLNGVEDFTKIKTF